MFWLWVLAYIVVGMVLSTIYTSVDSTASESAGCLVFMWPVALVIIAVTAAVCAIVALVKAVAGWFEDWWRYAGPMA